MREYFVQENVYRKRGTKCVSIFYLTKYRPKRGNKGVSIFYQQHVRRVFLL